MKKSITTYLLILVFSVLGTGCATTMQTKKVAITPLRPEVTVGTEIEPPTDLQSSSNFDISVLVDFIKSYNNRISQNDASLIADSILFYSNKFNVHYKIITALVAIESGFRPDAKSSSGAMGLGQLMPFTAKSLNIENPWDPYQNLNGAVSLLTTHLKNYNGDINYALAAYKMGAGTVSKTGISQPSTIDYIKKIRSVYDTVP